MFKPCWFLLTCDLPISLYCILLVIDEERNLFNVLSVLISIINTKAPNLAIISLELADK